MNKDLVNIGKKVVVEGVKVVSFGAGVTLLTTLAREGLTGVKNLNVTELLK